MIIYPGQEHLAEGKRHNQRVMAHALDGVRVEPGEVLSLWRCAGRPSARRGYLPGAAIVAGELTSEDGGATCQLSTVFYNAGLLAGLDVVERHAHSVDVYGEARYFEPGRDATIEYGVLDVRFRNPYPFAVLLELTTDDDRVEAVFRAPVPDLPTVAITAERPPAEGGTWRARTLRTITPRGTPPEGEMRRDRPRLVGLPGGRRCALRGGRPRLTLAVGGRPARIGHCAARAAHRSMRPFAGGIQHPKNQRVSPYQR